MKEYEMTSNMFLTHYLKVDLRSYSTKKWTHSKLNEIICSRGFAQIIMPTKEKRKEMLRDIDKICKGEILLVRDQTGKVEPYYNPYRMGNLCENYLGSTDPESLKIRIALLEKEIFKLCEHAHFTFETLSQEFQNYEQKLKELKEKKEELMHLQELFLMLEKQYINSASQRKEQKYDKHKRRQKIKRFKP